ANAFTPHQKQNHDAGDRTQRPQRPLRGAAPEREQAGYHEQQKDAAVAKILSGEEAADHQGAPDREKYVLLAAQLKESGMQASGPQKPPADRGAARNEDDINRATHGSEK